MTLAIVILFFIAVKMPTKSGRRDPLDVEPMTPTRPKRRSRPPKPVYDPGPSQIAYDDGNYQGMYGPQETAQGADASAGLPSYGVIIGGRVFVPQGGSHQEV